VLEITLSYSFNPNPVVKLNVSQWEAIIPRSNIGFNPHPVVKLNVRADLGFEFIE
jgi:hypothetical protein